MQKKYTYVIIFLFLNFFLLRNILAQTPHWRTVIDFDKKHYFAQTSNKQWGMCTRNNKFVIEAKYDTIYPLNIVKFDPNTYAMQATKTAYIIAKKGDEHSLFHVNGACRLMVDGIMPRLMGDIILVRKKKYWGLAKTSGQFLLPIKCPIIEWYGDLLALQYQKKWLLFDPEQGQLLDRIKFDHIIEVPSKNYVKKKTLLLVKQNNKWGVLDETIKTIIPIEYDEIKIEGTTFICKKGDEITRINK